LPLGNAAGKRKRGQLNGIQRQVWDVHDSIVKMILGGQPGLTVSEIARRFPDVRGEVLQSRNWRISQELRNRLSASEDPDNLRKTVRKHLVKMLDDESAKVAAGKYYLIDQAEQSVLVGLTHRVQFTIQPQNWQFLAANDCALFQTYVDPQKQRYDFDGFFLDSLSDFQRSLAYLDRILVDAIGQHRLSAGFWDQATRKVNVAELHRGLLSYFDGTRLLIGTWVISPSRLISYLETDVGEDKVAALMQDKGGDILAAGRKRLRETRWTQRKLRSTQPKVDSRGRASNR
jgi:hypothetical protein